MADDLQSKIEQLMSDPRSLVFLEVGETLRVRGELEAAVRITRKGLDHFPDHADGHDLYARILVDAGSADQAEEEWNVVLALDPRHVGARKGLAFLCYRRGELDAALDHLELALAADPHDRSVVEALRTVRNAADQAMQDASVRGGALPAAMVFAGLEGADAGLLLVDSRGTVLGGGLKSADQQPVGVEVAAYLAGVSQEAERTARLLDLGEWNWIVAETAEANMFLTQPTAGTLLLMSRDRSIPSGRLAILAGKATAAARQWLEAQAP